MNFENTSFFMKYNFFSMLRLENLIPPKLYTFNNTEKISKILSQDLIL
jgi:hypothetical protein